MKKIISLVFGLVICFSLQAQSDKEKAIELLREAVQTMDAGKPKAAIELLEKAEDLDPSNMDIPYEIGYAQIMRKEYKKAIRIYRKLRRHDDVNDRVFVMLGNAYDYDGQPKKAIGAYEEGLALFPNSGPLHLERGNMELHEEKYSEALNWYEKGIFVAPTYSSNYYWAAKIYMISTEEVWGMIYGELFINLERNSARTTEISKKLFETYKSEITFNDSGASISFCKNQTINLTIEDLEDPDKLKLPFGTIYEVLMASSTIEEKKIDIHSLNRIRTRFLKTYLGHEDKEKYPNVLFDFHEELQKKGFFECYNYWVLSQGDAAAFMKWRKKNQAQWDKFVDWFSKNPLELSADKKFYSGQY